MSFVTRIFQINKALSRKPSVDFCKPDAGGSVLSRVALQLGRVGFAFIDFSRVEHFLAFDLLQEGDVCFFAELDFAVETRAVPDVAACATADLDTQPHRILIIVDQYLPYPLEQAAGRALAP